MIEAQGGHKGRAEGADAQGQWAAHRAVGAEVCVQTSTFGVSDRRTVLYARLEKMR
jgi:hypothetical protein